MGGGDFVHTIAPWPGARKLGRGSRSCGSALHTTTDNAQQRAGGCGTFAPGAIQDTPPYWHRLRHRAE